MQSGFSVQILSPTPQILLYLFMDNLLYQFDSQLVSTPDDFTSFIRQLLRHAVQVGMEVVDVLFLITVSVYPRQRFIAVLVSIQVQALPFVCAAFLNHLQPVPQDGGAIAWLAVSVQPVFFDAPAKYIVDVAVAFSMVQLFDTHFG